MDDPKQDGGSNQCFSQLIQLKTQWGDQDSLKYHDHTACHPEMYQRKVQGVVKNEQERKYLHSNIITREGMLASKSTLSSWSMLPQSTVALRVSRNYSKVACRKWSKSQNVHLQFLSFFLFSPPSPPPSSSPPPSPPIPPSSASLAP